MPLSDFVPPLVKEIIRDRFVVGVADAEAGFEYSKADEDALTGALGHSISSRQPIQVRVGRQTYQVRTYYKKVRGRGPGAPERTTGSDGIFQIEVIGPNQVPVWTKGLPFQAKKQWVGTDSRLVTQARDMLGKAGQGLVIDYSPDGYKACPAAAVLDHGGRAQALSEGRMFRPLGQILGNDFLDCTIGVEGLTYDPEEEVFLTENDVHVIGAAIAPSGT
jgi:hypothetical protein